MTGSDPPLAPAPALSATAPWVSPAAEVAAGLEVDPAAGLSGPEAARRLESAGRNELHSESGPSKWVLFARQFQSLIIWVLLAAAGISAALGEVVDAVAIGVIVVLNAVIGFYQEFRAERALSALRQMTSPQARVLREGRTEVVPAAEVVPGDVLLLEAGDLVAADARLVETAAFRASEAPLTGESVPVEKDAAPLVDPATPLADRRNMVYMGTSVVGGQGLALVVATGMRTEVGQIARLLTEAGGSQTPLQQRLERVSRILLVASLGIVGLVFILGLLRGAPLAPMFLTAVSLAVAAIPEGLPAVVTIALSLGVGRMARRHALIRRLPAVETLGAAQVICSDKTGTLTVGEMTVRALWAGAREVEVTGEGYSARGEFLEGGRVVLAASDAALRPVLFAAVACNDAELREAEGTATVLGDPTEGALLAAGAKAGLQRAPLEADYPRLRVLPFDSDRKRMTIIRETPEGPRAFVKGAPDLVLARASHWLGPDGTPRPLADADREAVRAANDALAARALRVLAVARRALAGEQVLEADTDTVEQELLFLGLLAMHDPPRSEAREAIARCQRAGIRVVMITGDHPVTAGAIARELGILQADGEVLTGAELAALGDEELRRRVEHVAAYARVTAADKLRVVRALQSRGLVAAMTGDGVNDAPAVKEAAIGVAMGRTGTEVTKEAADMVVTDDNFASIVAAVEEGRGVYENIKKCLQYLLAGNTAEIGIMLVAALAGWPMPLLPLHILWINLVTDGLPALALAADPVARDVMDRPPRPADEQLADPPFLGRLLLAGASAAGVSLLAFYFGWRMQQDLTAARTYAFGTLVATQLFLAVGMRSPSQPCWYGFFTNRLLLLVLGGSFALQGIIHHTPLVQRLFDIRDISLPTGMSLISLGSIPLLVIEVWKTVTRWSGSQGYRAERQAQGR